MAAPIYCLLLICKEPIEQSIFSEKCPTSFVKHFYNSSCSRVTILHFITFVGGLLLVPERVDASLSENIIFTFYLYSILELKSRKA